MFEITQPSSSSSSNDSSVNFSSSNPPKSDSGVIRGQPSFVPINDAYNLILDISNVGNEHSVHNVYVKIHSLIPIGDPAFNLETTSVHLEELAPNEQKDACISLTLKNPFQPPINGDQYRVLGSIYFFQESEPGLHKHGIDTVVQVSTSANTL